MRWIGLWNLARDVVDAPREMGQVISIHQLDRIYVAKPGWIPIDDIYHQLKDPAVEAQRNLQPHCRRHQYRRQLHHTWWSSVRTLDGQILNFDTYAGRTCADIYINKINQRKSMFGKLQNGSLNDDMLKNFLTELRHKARRPIWGLRWMDLLKMNEWWQSWTLQRKQASQRLRWQMAATNPPDVELENSDVPLLLSAGAQQRLGLVIDMGNHTIYSRTLKELELIVHNGLIVCLPLHFLENLDWAISCWTPRSSTTSGILSRMTTPFPMMRPSNMTWRWRMRTMKWTKKAVTTCRSLRERLRFRRASNFKNPWTKWRRRTVPWGLGWERSTEDEDVAMQVLGGNICLCYLTCWAFRQPSTMTATTLEEIQSGPPGEVDWGRRCLLALFGAGLWTMEQVAVCQHVRKIKFHNLLICYLWWTLVKKTQVWSTILNVLILHYKIMMHSVWPTPKRTYGTK